jgi:hypothetical protein
MLNIINGIIVDTFQSLREENNKKQEIRKQLCYICSINRAKFETNGVVYKHHLNREHNIIAYLQYIYYITKKTDAMKLQELDVLKKLEEGLISFFPIKASASLQNN